jgi:hypothetical protein
MAYMNQDRKKVISAAVKPILAKYGMKGSLRTDRSTVTLTLQSGPIDFIADMVPDRAGYALENLKKGAKYHFDVNQYWYSEHFIGSARNLLDELVPAMKSADWYDRSDIMTDFFDVSYYFHIRVGRWDKPYVLTPVYVR